MLGHRLGLLKRSPGMLGRSLGVLGCSLGVLGRSLSVLGHSLGVPGYSLGMLGHSLVALALNFSVLCKPTLRATPGMLTQLLVRLNMLCIVAGEQQEFASTYIHT